MFDLILLRKKKSFTKKEAFLQSGLDEIIPLLAMPGFPMLEERGYQ